MFSARQRGTKAAGGLPHSQSSNHNDLATT
jgi:hypothetical protein